MVKTSSQEEGVSRREWLLVYLVSQTLKPVNDLFLYSAFLSIKYLIFDLLFTHVSWLRRCLGSFRLIQIFSVLDLSRLSCEKLIFSKDLNLVLQMAISTWRFPVARGRRKCADFSDEFHLSSSLSLLADYRCPVTMLSNFSIKIISGSQHKRHRSLFAEGKNHEIPKNFLFLLFYRFLIADRTHVCHLLFVYFNKYILIQLFSLNSIRSRNFDFPSNSRGSESDAYRVPIFRAMIQKSSL